MDDQKAPALTLREKIVAAAIFLIFTLILSGLAWVLFAIICFFLPS